MTNQPQHDMRLVSVERAIELAKMKILAHLGERQADFDKQRQNGYASEPFVREAFEWLEKAELALQPQPPAQGEVLLDDEVTSEQWWLIEREQQADGKQFFCGGVEEWTADAQRAVRFPTKQSAQYFLDCYTCTALIMRGYAKPVGHTWIMPDLAKATPIIEQRVLDAVWQEYTTRTRAWTRESFEQAVREQMKRLATPQANVQEEGDR